MKNYYIVQHIILHFGSRRTIIYTNGDVYDDLEIENPNHEPNYKYLKTLNKDELNDLKYKINSSDGYDMEDYELQLVYGVEEFDNMGGY